MTHQLLQVLLAIGEYKGRQALYKNQTPQTLERLREIAVIQSTESSNRIEGVTAPQARIEQLLKDKTKPRNRSEQEIVGYRNVLNTIHKNYNHIPLNIDTVLQFHKELYSFNPEFGGRWKQYNNDILEIMPDGSSFLRFAPTPANLTDAAMRELHDDYARMRDAGEFEPLLLIASYVLDFLCIHPFADGNGRVARLLTLLLLYKEGYLVGRYISFEHIIEETKESYYNSLYRSSQGWHENNHEILSWCEYLMGVVILTAYQQFESRVGVITKTKGSRTEAVEKTIARLPQQFKFSDLEKACPSVSAATIRLTLQKLKKDKHIRCIVAGRNAIWQKTKSNFWDNPEFT